MSQTHHHQAFVELMRALFEEQKSSWHIERADSQEEQVDILQTLIWSSEWTPLAKFEEFDWIGEVRFKEHKRVMLLPRLEKGESLIPVLSVQYLPSDDFARSSLHIHVLLLKERDEGKLLGFGFRIESPHAYEYEDEKDAEGVGRHDFYHAQLISGIGYGAKLDLPDWWPCTQPSFPLWAANPVDAVLNLILTLYGVPYYKKFLTSHGRKFLRNGPSKEFKRLNDRLVRAER